MLLKTITWGLILFSGISAFADTGAAGTWTGWGIWTYDGSGTNCNMKIQFSETDGVFKRDGGAFDCNVVALYSDELSWQKSGSDLLLDGEVMGHHADNFVQLVEPVNDRTKAVTTFEIKGNKAHYLEIWSTDGKVLYRIEGNFTRR